MRLVALLLVPLLLAGCASPGTPATPGVPATSHVATPTGAPGVGTVNETPIFQFQKTYNGSSTPYAASFPVERAGWLCVHAFLTPSAGNAAITIIDPSGAATTITSTADHVLRNDTVLANDGPGTWHLRVDLQGYSGDVGVLVSQMG